MFDWKDASKELPEPLSNVVVDLGCGCMSIAVCTVDERWIAVVGDVIARDENGEKIKIAPIRWSYLY